MSVLKSTSESFWVGALASSIGHFLNGRIDERQLRGYYRDFLRSPVCDEELTPLLPKLSTRKVKH